jgi:phosphatidylglycerophosphatase A
MMEEVKTKMSEQDKPRSKSYGSTAPPSEGLGRLARLLSSVFGIGYIKGGGTVAALVCCLCIYGCWYYGLFSSLIFIVATIIITFTGIWLGNVVEPYWGKDSGKVVIDEVAGMCVSLLFVKISFTLVLLGFVLFRVFDITKAFGVHRMERFPGGWGVMAVDVLAGIYTNLLLQLFVLFTNLFPG